MKKLFAIALILVSVSAFAQAHLRTVQGYVKSFDETNLVVEQPNGKELTITITNKTSVERGRRTDLIEGRRIAAKVTAENRAVTVYVGEEVRKSEE